MVALQSKLELIKYRDSGMSTYTYFWINENKSVQSPYFDSADEAMAWLPSPTLVQDSINEDDEFARIERENGTRNTDPIRQA